MRLIGLDLFQMAMKSMLTFLKHSGGSTKAPGMAPQLFIFPKIIILLPEN